MTRLIDRLREQGERGPVGTPAEPATPAVRVPADRAEAAGGAPTEQQDALDQVRQALLRDRPELLAAALAERRTLREGVAEILCRDNIVVGGMTREDLAENIAREIAGFGPIDPLLADPAVTDVMVNSPAEIYSERDGALQRSGARFRDEEHLKNTVLRVLAPLGRRLDNLNPYVDARLPDGSRLNVIIPPLATRGWTLTIRRFRREPFSLAELAGLGMMGGEVAAVLAGAARCRLNILVSGGAGSGKTTLLNALCLALADERQRLIAIEDAQELQLAGIHAVGLEARPPNLEGMGEVPIRQLVRNALRMRPDRLVIGEVRDAAAYDLVLAINTGHDGSMCTLHANSAADALRRMANLALTSGANLVHEAIREQILRAVDLVVHLARDEGGGRQVRELAVVRPPGLDGKVEVSDLLAPGEGDTALDNLRRRAGGRCAEERAGELLRLAEGLVPA